MEYEIYIDSLFLLNLGLNLYLLELVNCMLHHTAGLKRIMLGAVSGSILSIVPLLLPIHIGIAGCLGFLLSVLGMTCVTFKIAEIKVYFRVVEILMGMTIVLGAVIRYLFERLPHFLRLQALGILLLGAVCFIVLRHHLERRNQVQTRCKVTLRNHGTMIRVDALVDTGNTLIEPISGLPVSVLDKKVFENLFYKKAPAGFRVIPYHSVDKKNGLMPGYLVPDVQVEWDGLCVEYKDIYVAVRPEDMEGTEKYKMIINPKMLKKGKAG